MARVWKITVLPNSLNFKLILSEFNILQGNWTAYFNCDSVEPQTYDTIVTAEKGIESIDDLGNFVVYVLRDVLEIPSSNILDDIVNKEDGTINLTIRDAADKIDVFFLDVLVKNISKEDIVLH